MSSHWQSRWALWSHAAEAENTRLNWSRSMYKGAWMIHCPSCICHKKLNLRNFVFNHLWRPRISRTVRKWGRVLWDCRAYACAYACHSFLENIWLWSRFCTHTHTQECKNHQRDTIPRLLCLILTNLHSHLHWKHLTPSPLLRLMLFHTSYPLYSCSKTAANMTR